MGVTTKRRRVTMSPEDRRRDILDAAVGVLSRNGIPNTTIADITEAAGVAKGTFYLYFDSKEHLLAALRERFVNEMMVHAAPFLERIGKQDWGTLSEEVVESIIDFTLEHGDTIVIFMQEPHTPETRDILAACEARPIEMMTLGIQAGVDAGVFEVSDPSTTASLLFHALEGTVMHAILYGEKPDRDRIVAAAQELFRKLLALSPATA